MEISIASEVLKAINKAEKLRNELINLHEKTAREDYTNFNEESSQKLKELGTMLEHISYWYEALKELENPDNSPIEYVGSYNITHATCLD